MIEGTIPLDVSGGVAGNLTTDAVPALETASRVLALTYEFAVSCPATALAAASLVLGAMVCAQRSVDAARRGIAPTPFGRVSAPAAVAAGSWAAIMLVATSFGIEPTACAGWRSAAALALAGGAAGLAVSAMRTVGKVRRSTLAAVAIGVTSCYSLVALLWTLPSFATQTWAPGTGGMIGANVAMTALQFGLIARHHRKPTRFGALTALGATGLSAVGLMAVWILLAATNSQADGLAAPSTVPWVFAAAAALVLGAGLVHSDPLLRSSARPAKPASDPHRHPQRRLDESTIDALTGLPNRTAIQSLLRAVGPRAETESEGIALFLVGMDGFKLLNESYGHDVGDHVLLRVADRLTNREDLGEELHGMCLSAARMSGDEFVVVMRGQFNRKLVNRIAKHLLRLLQTPTTIIDTSIDLAASIGVAVFPDDGGVSTLIANADTALKAAKESGGATYALFEARRRTEARERVVLLNDLRRAIEQHQLELVYQPKVEATTGKVTSAEALLRWHHPTRGSISPVVFIPIAERYGLIVALGNWVFEEACRQARAWADAGLLMRVAINLSAYQMRQENLVDRIQETLQRHDIQPDRITCEITESVAMENTAVTQETFRRLGEAGVHLSIDDFGTGYSSLSSLRHLPATELKIDRSFVQDLGENDDALAIVEAIIRMAHAIDMNVVAEGVETATQRDILIELKCNELQGFLFARPMSAKALMLWANESIDAVDSDFKASLFASMDSSETPVDIAI